MVSNARKPRPVSFDDRMQGDAYGRWVVGGDHRTPPRLGIKGKVPSIGIVAEISGNGLAEAKNLVHFSDGWSDVNEQDEEFHARLARAFGDNEKP